MGIIATVSTILCLIMATRLTAARHIATSSTIMTLAWGPGAAAATGTAL